jgi:hypothetical protein
MSHALSMFRTGEQPHSYRDLHTDEVARRKEDTRAALADTYFDQLRHYLHPAEVAGREEEARAAVAAAAAADAADARVAVAVANFEQAVDFAQTQLFTAVFDLIQWITTVAWNIPEGETGRVILRLMFFDNPTAEDIRPLDKVAVLSGVPKNLQNIMESCLRLKAVDEAYATMDELQDRPEATHIIPVSDDDHMTDIVDMVQQWSTHPDGSQQWLEGGSLWTSDLWNPGHVYLGKVHTMILAYQTFMRASRGLDEQGKYHLYPDVPPTLLDLVHTLYTALHVPATNEDPKQWRQWMPLLRHVRYKLREMHQVHLHHLHEPINSSDSDFADEKKVLDNLRTLTDVDFWTSTTPEMRHNLWVFVRGTRQCTHVQWDSSHGHVLERMLKVLNSFEKDEYGRWTYNSVPHHLGVRKRGTGGDSSGGGPLGGEHGRFFFYGDPPMPRPPVTTRNLLSWMDSRADFINRYLSTLRRKLTTMRYNPEVEYARAELLDPWMLIVGEMPLAWIVQQQNDAEHSSQRRSKIVTRRSRKSKSTINK